MALGPQIKVITMARGPQIKVKISPAGSLQPTGGITLKNFVNDVTRLDQLKDVVEPENATEGSVLVYQADTDKYVVQQINLDGGTF